MKSKTTIRSILIWLFVILVCVLLVNELSPQRVDLFSNWRILKSNSKHLQQITGCQNQVLTMQSLQYGQYWLLQNLYRGLISERVNCAATITLTTHGDYTFLDNLQPLLLRWMAPISLTLFAPATDIIATLTSIQYVRHCLPHSDLIRQYVSFHIFFPLQHFATAVPRSEAEAHNWHYDCLKNASYLHVNASSMYKSQHKLAYPINVARNIARKSANTHFILASDIELYPSLQLVEQFLHMIQQNPQLVAQHGERRVYPLPIFEVNITQKAPLRKAALLDLLQKKLALPFHNFYCPNCHLVPKQRKWYITADSNEMSVVTISKRHGEFKHWEPIYISDNTEPYYDERLSWDGENDKKVQGLALCQLDYEFHILHPAFLVHRPGIKRNRYHNKLAVSKTFSLIDRVIKPQYKLIYGSNTLCDV